VKTALRMTCFMMAIAPSTPTTTDEANRLTLYPVWCTSKRTASKVRAVLVQSDGPMTRSLAANNEVRPTFRGIAQLNIGLAEIPAVLIWNCTRNVIIEKDAGVLHLAEDSEPFRGLNCHVNSDTAQQICIVRRCVTYAILAFDARAEFAAESKPARQSMVQAINREQPGSGFVAIECVFRSGLLTPGWLCKNAAEAKKRNECNRAGGWHTLLRLGMQGSGQNLNVAYIDGRCRPELFETRLRQHMST
jgi:hypothetical protein